ncbi:MAG: SAF domain-containing protein [Planctomycetaceae bacterium]
MHTASPSRADQHRRHRPSRVTVFTTAFVAGAAVAFGVNRMLDVHLAQTRPQVECEPIFVALHSLPQGSPITVWDVALKDWPRAMLPTSALRARDTFEGMVLRHPLREGQPLLSVQLVPAEGAARSATPAPEQPFTPPSPATQAAAMPEADLWAPAPAASPEVAATPDVRRSRTDVDAVPVTPTTLPEAPATDTADTFVAPEPAREPTLAATPEPAREPTLAATESAVDPHAEAVQPELLVTTDSLYAPVPASPPSDLDGPLAGVGGLTATGAPSQADAGASVLKPGTIETPAATPSQSAGRYLVVPERIALQADASFAPPPAAQSPALTTQAQPTAVTKTATKPVNRTATGQGATSQRSGTKRQPQPQSGQGNARQATAPNRPLGGMFPSLTAGIEAIGGGQRKPAAAVQPSSTPR